jgi:hypothetical protein
VGRYDTSDPETGELLDEQGVPLSELGGDDPDSWYADGDVSLADWALFLGTGGASSYFGGDVPSFGSWSVADDDGDGEPNVSDPDALPTPDFSKLPGASEFGNAAGKAIGLGVVALVAAKLLRLF